MIGVSLRELFARQLHSLDRTETPGAVSQIRKQLTHTCACIEHRVTGVDVGSLYDMAQNLRGAFCGRYIVYHF